MDEATKQGAYGGYGFAIRTFWFNVTDLRLHRCWSRDSLITEKSEFSDFVTGKAVSEDRVGVIGREGSVNEFDFTLRVDTDAKESWEWHKAHDVLAYTDHSRYKPEHVRIKKLVNDFLDADPPTAVLFTDRDNWEIGTKAGWFIECTAPSEVLAKLIYDIAAQTVVTVTIGVKWKAGLVRDEHAPPSFPTDWGLFCLEENRSPEPLRGHVNSIRWSPTNRVETTPEKTDEEVPALPSAPASIAPPVNFNIPKSAIAALWVLAVAAVLHLLK
jgi:hypothetical protein